MARAWDPSGRRRSGIGDRLWIGASSGTAVTPTPAPYSAAPTPTPLPPTALTVQSAFTVEDTDQFDLAGSTSPGANVVVIATSVVNGAAVDLTAIADTQGHFSVHLPALPEGLTSWVVSATANGFSTATADVAITRTISAAFYKRSAAVISYNQLVKDPAALAGRVVTYAGQVFQYDTNTTTQHMIVAVTNLGYGYWTDNVWLDVDPTMTANICNKTVVRFWGTIVGPYSYTTTNNGNLTIPEIQVKYINATAVAC